MSPDEFVGLLVQDGGYLHAVWSIIPARIAAVSAALVMTLLNAGGIKRSVRVTDVVVILSVMSLLAFVVIGLPHARISNLSPFATGGIGGILRATGLLFFAYTGYSRIATLVEESAQSEAHNSDRDNHRTRYSRGAVSSRRNNNFDNPWSVRSF